MIFRIFTTKSSYPGRAFGKRGLALPCGGLAALTAGGLLLGARAALRRAASGTGLLPAALRCAGGIRDAGGPFLGHAFLLQSFVLLLVLHAGSFVGHHGLLSRCCRPPTPDSEVQSPAAAKTLSCCR